MKALVQQTYGPVENLRVAELEKPTPAAKAVLIRVRAAGLDPGVWHIMTGRPYMVRLMGLGFSRPKVPVAGWDAAGVVESVGEGVTRFKPGDEVFGNCDARGTGTFAEYACLPEDRCAPKPTNLGFDQSAVLPVSGCTALQCVRDLCKVGSGMRVLVLGASGGVGHFAVQIAKAYGATVTGVCSTSKLDFVSSLGAAEVIDYTRERLGSDSRRWDAVIDTAGRRSFAELRGVLAPKGVLAIVGGEGGNAWTGGFLERILVASVLSLFSSQKLLAVNATVNVPDLLVLKGLAEEGKLTPAIDRRYRLDEGVAGLKELEKGHARGKSVVVIE
ncbi:MAG: NAD(P)-dependent alcohol dehydrogenase [Deltaproteobacteria bacterium]|nr:NAD(P)-dependent alcohol dehydrogenase [Deltaproteobacteria bacterium]